MARLGIFIDDEQALAMAECASYDGDSPTTHQRIRVLSDECLVLCDPVDEKSNTFATQFSAAKSVEDAKAICESFASECPEHAALAVMKSEGTWLPFLLGPECDVLEDDENRACLVVGEGATELRAYANPEDSFEQILEEFILRLDESEDVDDHVWRCGAPVACAKATDGRWVSERGVVRGSWIVELDEAQEPTTVDAVRLCCVEHRADELRYWEWAAWDGEAPKLRVFGPNGEIDASAQLSLEGFELSLNLMDGEDGVVHTAISSQWDQVREFSSVESLVEEIAELIRSLDVESVEEEPPSA